MRPPPPLTFGDKALTVSVRCRRGCAYDKDMALTTRRFFQLKVADLAGLKMLFQFHSIPPVLHAGSGRCCAAAWAIAIVGLFLQKSLAISITHFFVTMNQKGKYMYTKKFVIVKIKSTCYNRDIDPQLKAAGGQAKKKKRATDYESKRISGLLVS